MEDQLYSGSAEEVLDIIDRIEDDREIDHAITSKVINHMVSNFHIRLSKASPKEIETILGQSDATLHERIELLLQTIDNMIASDFRLRLSELLEKWERLQTISAIADHPEQWQGEAFSNLFSLEDTELWPVTPALPEMVTRAAEFKLEKSAAKNSAKQSIINRANALPQTLMKYAEVIAAMQAQDSLTIKGLDQEMRAFVLNNLNSLPIDLRPLDQLCDSEFDPNPTIETYDSIISCLWQYPVDTIMEQWGAVNAILHQATANDYRLRQEVFNLIDRIQDQKGLTAEAFQSLIPANDPHALLLTFTETKRHCYEQFMELMTVDYLLDIARHNPDASTIMKITAQDTSTAVNPIDQFSFSKNVFSEVLSRSLHNSSIPHPDAKLNNEQDMDAYRRAYLRNTAKVIDTLGLHSVYGSMVDVISGFSSPLPMFVDAVDYAKPYLKKSMLDELLEYRDGHRLYDDILSINELALTLTKLVAGKNAEVKALSSIEKRVERITYEVIKRMEHESGHTDCTQDKKPAFDQTL
jgi:hypothetical protein